MPAELDYIWGIYIDLRKGCDNVGYVELDAYQRVTGLLLSLWEIELLLDVDLIRRSNG